MFSDLIFTTIFLYFTWNYFVLFVSFVYSYIYFPWLLNNCDSLKQHTFILSPSSGIWKSKIKVCAELCYLQRPLGIFHLCFIQVMVGPGIPRLGCMPSVSFSVVTWSPPLQSVKSSLWIFYTNTCHWVKSPRQYLRWTQCPSFNHVCKDHFSK